MKYIKMPKEIAAKWLAGLRSGEYKQVRRFMESVDDQGNASYCCLGVLQMVTDGKVQPEKERYGAEMPSFKWLVSHGVEFRDHEDDSSCDPYLPALGGTASLANDIGDDFCAIADAIEETLETY